MNSENGKKPYDRQEILEAALLAADHVDAMLAFWDRNCMCRFANRAYFSWFGKSREELLGKHISVLLGKELYEKNLPYINIALSGTKQVFEREIPLASGGTRNSITTYTPYIVDGRVEGFLVFVADSSLAKKLEQELKAEKARAMEMATHDFLTGLPNRVLLDDRIKSAIAHAERNKKLFAVMSMDLDKFKGINDTFGHDVGDKLLKEIASRLKGALREMDTVSRIGGDEFILISMDLTTEKDAETVAAKVLESVRKPFECVKDSFTEPTFSIGIAVYSIHGYCPDDLIKSSDEALYKAKESGKNRFEFAAVTGASLRTQCD
jgi:diguanylate cyclase (GGDEF)-like protein/PAS domain S-box-containing protein